MKNKEILAYKGFDKDLKCKGYQFEAGKTFKHDGEVIVCKSGFHACENPLDVFIYYPVIYSRFAVVKCGGEISRQENGDSKIACSKLVVEEEIKLPELIEKCADWILSKFDFDDKNRKNTNNSISAATGYKSASAAAGYGSASAATGGRSTSVAAGYGSVSAATGHWSTSVVTGGWSISAATGCGSASVATGDGSASVATGYGSASVVTGHWSAAEASGEHSAACALGFSSKARAGKNGAIVCVYVDNDTKTLVHIKASKVGENGIKPDTWYTLDSDGNFKEVE